MATDKRLKRFRSRYRRSNVSEKTNSKEDKENAGKKILKICTIYFSVLNLRKCRN